MSEPLVDFEFLKEISGNDPVYIYEVMQIFLDSTPAGLAKLHQMIKSRDSWDEISKQAHSLKSSLGIIKIKDMHGQMADIEHITRGKKTLSQVEQAKVDALIETAVAIFAEAEPLLRQEMNRSKPA